MTSIISIHAAREGGDVSLLYVLIIHREFQSTPPVKAATSGARNHSLRSKISIHAAREGGDVEQHGLQAISADFNPRRP